MFSFRKIAGSVFFSFFLLFINQTANSQSQGFESPSMFVKEFGSFKAIEKDSIFDIAFSYEQMRVSGFETEDLFVSHMVSTQNEKESGSGDIWLQEWKNAKKDYFEPEFISILNNVLDKKNKKFVEGSNAKHILLVNTIYLEPGNKTNDINHPPFGHFEFYFFEKSNPEKAVLKLYVQDISGFQKSTIDPDIGSRISSCYKKVGKLFGKYIYPYL